jgi:hypothetical protein
MKNVVIYYLLTTFHPLKKDSGFLAEQLIRFNNMLANILLNDHCVFFLVYSK